MELSRDFMHITEEKTSRGLLLKNFLRNIYQDIETSEAVSTLQHVDKATKVIIRYLQRRCGMVLKLQELDFFSLGLYTI